MTILFCNIGWMNNYCGENDDKIVNGGSYVDDTNSGHEDRNFLAFSGYYYGYVRNRGNSFDLERISGESDIKTPYIDGVDIIWTATNPVYGNVVIGWYRNARVFRMMQKLDSYTEKPRAHFDEEESYWFKARTENCLLLPIEERTIRVPRNGKGLMGTSPFWYGDSPEGADFVTRVKNLVNLRTPIPSKDAPDDLYGKSDTVFAIYNSTPELRKKTETSAIDKATKYYENLGYIVKSVERDNVGWDLEARKINELLRIEVKGLFGLSKQIQLTPNEYNHFKKNEPDYRLCIINNALSDDDFGLFICYFSSDSNNWKIEGSKVGIVKYTEYMSAAVQLIF
ncbi:TPA: DUF3883 domain-containing protein [Morganella morganii]|uniref:protein NO VEIN domain-containing protein n=1 Tax=Morganella morganii TaxID=582 RepID=UPI00298E5759|nr:DUF3883 domain-containing protein [Morganella morganii]MDW7782610.1 DUF3883 domain-containing protein [Morganella morganii]MDW7790027.1 DUF3883 domain-containing protein [Morganella morganii]HCR3230186.1 DUF3883 domain-containing protein [Morganella morganii]HCR3777631.1 DUF3883 domain-containing protein [Morganella morganii]